jgi:uncharacterized protein (DUF305 family)
MTDDVERQSRRAEDAVFADDAVPFRPLDEPNAAVPTDAAGGGVDDDDVVVLSWWQHPVNVIGLVVAVALIGGMLGWLIRDTGVDERGNAADVGFLHDMRAHHEQAVQMSYIFIGLDDTAPALRTVAGSILVGQNIEIGRMIQMLRDMRQPEAAESDAAMSWMGMTTTQEQMPGMATQEQLDELAASSGTAADDLFVELMIAHHEGGVHMAEAAVEDASLSKVTSFARSMIVGQRGEIVELQQLVE